MYVNGEVYLGLAENGERVILPLSACNRHGLIAGSTGTGKTVTMQVLAESFSDAAVPVFVCDIKGDVSGLCVPGAQTDAMEERIDRFGIRGEFAYKSFPVTFWDLYGKSGHPVRATVSDIGPTLLSRILNLTEVQEGVMGILFRIADDKGMKILDLKDLRTLLSFVTAHRSDYIPVYGNMSAQTLGAITRALLPLEDDGGELFFGEPMLDIRDFIRTDAEGRGVINVLDSVKLSLNPKLYSMFLLWMLSELYEELPEVGDLEKPKLVFFFDEAHMLFTDTPRALVAKIEQVIKLIRSKGVGVFFVTQNPRDIPESVLAQLSNRVQHALRAYTPEEQKAVRAAALSFRANPDFDTEEVITQLGVGKALVSVLDGEGVPTVVQKTAILCPQSKMGAADPADREAAVAADGMERYDHAIDSYSAFEQLEEQRILEEERARLEAEKKALEKEKAELAKQKAKEAAAKKKKQEQRQRRIESELISIGGSVIRRGILNILKKK